MKSYIYKEKTEDLALDLALSSLNLDVNDIIYEIKYVKCGILNNYVEVYVYIIEDIINEVRDNLNKILNIMKIEAQIQIVYKDSTIFIDVDSENNNVLIGKNGDVLAALSIIFNRYIRKYGNLKIRIDIGNYQKNKNKEFENFIKSLIEQVKDTKMSYKIDSINLYQKKIIYDLVNKDKDVIYKNVYDAGKMCIEIKSK